MKKPTVKLLCQIYTILALLAATAMSALPFSLLALILLLVMLFTTLRPVLPRIQIVLTVVTIFLTPLLLDLSLQYFIPFPLIFAQMMVTISSLLLVCLLDVNLRQNTQQIKGFGEVKKTRKRGRYTSNIYNALVVSVLTILLISFLLDNLVLLFTSVIIALYLLSLLIRIFLAVPLTPLDVPLNRKRGIAGSNITISLDITSKVPLRLYCLIIPTDSWVQATPQRFILIRGKTKLNFTFTPPLAGPAHPQFLVSVTDPWGFTRINQLIEPVELHVIPRAKYAQWLALKYLEQTGAGVVAATMLPPKAFKTPQRGIEYLNSRNYQPGDQLKNIDWKHTLKLSRLIIKEYIEAGEQAAMIAVNLSVADAEEADEIAFNLITAALTLARESIPTALAAYNHQRVVLTTTVTDPQEILKHTLSLVKDITMAEFTQQVLEPSDLNKIRRNIARLGQAKSESAQRLLDIFNFEYHAIEETARNHPATIALSSVATHIPSPAMILLVSQLNHDNEAIMVTTEKLSRREFITIPLQTSGSRQHLFHSHTLS